MAGSRFEDLFWFNFYKEQKSKMFPDIVRLYHQDADNQLTDRMSATSTDDIDLADNRADMMTQLLAAHASAMRGLPPCYFKISRTEGVTFPRRRKGLRRRSDEPAWASSSRRHTLTSRSPPSTFSSNTSRFRLGRRAQGLAGAYVEACGMQRALDAAILQPAVGELGVFMGADVVGGAKVAARQVIQRNLTPADAHRMHLAFRHVRPRSPPAPNPRPPYRSPGFSSRTTCQPARGRPRLPVARGVRQIPRLRRFLGCWRVPCSASGPWRIMPVVVAVAVLPPSGASAQHVMFDAPGLLGQKKAPPPPAAARSTHRVAAARSGCRALPHRGRPRPPRCQHDGARERRRHPAADCRIIAQPTGIQILSRQGLGRTAGQAEHRRQRDRLDRCLAARQGAWR